MRWDLEISYRKLRLFEATLEAVKKAMGVLRRLLEAIAEITLRLGEEVEKGYGLGNWGDQMKFLHALQP